MEELKIDVVADYRIVFIGGPPDYDAIFTDDLFVTLDSLGWRYEKIDLANFWDDEGISVEPALELLGSAVF